MSEREVGRVTLDGEARDADRTVEVMDGLVGGVEGEAVVVVVVEGGHVADEVRPGRLAPEGVVLGDPARRLHPTFPGSGTVRDGAEVLQVSRSGIGRRVLASDPSVAAQGCLALVNGTLLGPGAGGVERSALGLVLEVVLRVEVGEFPFQSVEPTGQPSDVVARCWRR